MWKIMEDYSYGSSDDDEWDNQQCNNDDEDDDDGEFLDGFTEIEQERNGISGKGPSCKVVW